MMPIMRWIAVAVLAAAGLFMVMMFAAGVRERVLRAAVISALAVTVITGGAALILANPDAMATGVASWVITILAVVFLAVSLIPAMPQIPAADLSHAERFDERMHMFSRANLPAHPELWERHHRLFPEHEAVDTTLRALPELGMPGSRFYDPAVSPMAEAAFSVLERSYPALARRPHRERGIDDPGELARIIDLAARRWGAADVGFTRTRPYHWYSYAGRQAEDWGQQVEPEHPTAIVLVVPMDFHAIRMAPAAPVLAESSRQYVEAAKIAHLVAELLALNGYEARAHVDARYRVLCAPLAEDAGLGHVGRIGIFMHRRYGPCVRLSIVTTNAELPETPGDFAYMEHFCRICKKCADNCPSRAIPRDEKPVRRGFPHWSIDQEKCYSFWRRIGTDCSICIASCPFTKPDSLVHRLVRLYIRRNLLNQRIALLGDDLFYGRRTKRRSANPTLEELARCWKL